MNLQVKEQIKTLLVQRNVTIKKLAEMISDYTGENCRPDSLSHKLKRGTLTYNDVLVIAKLLNYRIIFEDLNNG